jgi:hypothetical protein
MVLAATTNNRVQAQDILRAATARTPDTDTGSEDAWETDGGRLGTTNSLSERSTVRTREER